jgi:hypothetical protein
MEKFFSFLSATSEMKIVGIFKIPYALNQAAVLTGQTVLSSAY